MQLKLQPYKARSGSGRPRRNLILIYKGHIVRHKAKADWTADDVASVVDEWLHRSDDDQPASKSEPAKSRHILVDR